MFSEAKRKGKNKMYLSNFSPIRPNNLSPNVMFSGSSKYSDKEVAETKARFVFIPMNAPTDLNPEIKKEYKEITLTLKNGMKVKSWYSPPTEKGKGVEIFCHGNMSPFDKMQDAALRMLDHKKQLGIGALFVEYPRYGVNANIGPEIKDMRDTTLNDTVEAALEFTNKEGIPNSRTLVHAISLGGSPGSHIAAVAPYLGSREPLAGLILEGTITSMDKLLSDGRGQKFADIYTNLGLFKDIPDLRDIVEEMPKRPLDLSFNVIENLKKVQNTPTLIVCARNDMVVPSIMSNELLKARPYRRTKFNMSEDGDHRNMGESSLKAVNDFVIETFTNPAR
ncbi:MAG: hypothetical protein A2Y25_05940 [Candidatus Melainabacteria bacterium GWF2_37_15]|nr:MAG: hypothetical protein A2Y25_05940 [Candidatus Melainabacteria bacterium GWF2_37_15]